MEKPRRSNAVQVGLHWCVRDAGSDSSAHGKCVWTADGAEGGARHQRPMASRIGTPPAAEAYSAHALSLKSASCSQHECTKAPLPARSQPPGRVMSATKRREKALRLAMASGVHVRRGGRLAREAAPGRGSGGEGWGRGVGGGAARGSGDDWTMEQEEAHPAKQRLAHPEWPEWLPRAEACEVWCAAPCSLDASLDASLPPMLPPCHRLASCHESSAELSRNSGVRVVGAWSGSG